MNTKNPASSSGTGPGALFEKLRLAVLVATAAIGFTAQASTDYGPAIWNPPCNANYNTSGSGHKFHVVHDIEGYYLSTISYFKGCGFTAASVHYLVNGKKDATSDAPAGEITQMVRDAHYAWHARCWNGHSTGTEHEGFASNPAWYTETMYQASAGLTAHLGNKFGWAKDRNHVIAHGQKSVAGWPAYASGNLGIDPYCNDHTDPGPYWDWNHYMALVNGGAPPAGVIHDYLGALGGDGTLIAKDGPYGGWTTQLGGVSAFQIEGGRIGVLQNGALLCKDGGLWGSWLNLSAGGVVKFQLCGNRVGALYGNGILSCKDGLYGTWYDQLSGVSAFYLDGDRIGIIAGGVVYTKWGLQGAWTTQTGPGVVKLQIKGERLGVLYSDGLFSCKDTENGAWYNQLGGVTDFRLDGNRIAALAGGVLYVKDGLQGAWTTQTGPGFVQIEIRGERIGALGSDGTLICKDGLYGSWFTQLGGVSRFQLDGDRIGLITSAGAVTLKYGLQGGWLNQTGNGFSGFQLATWVEGTTPGNPSLPPASIATSTIVDNASAGFSVTGTWATASSATDKYGADYRYHSTAAVDQPATWTASLPTSSTYEVSAWWAQGGNRSATAPYIVYHSSGSTTVSKNQQTGGGTWQSLGTFNLNAGNNSVKLSCWTTTGFIVVADAVRWLPQ
jgi:hypothetical protein